MIADAHCHFFSSRFLELLSQPIPDLPAEGRAVVVASRLGWSDSGNPAALAATWIAELDRHSVSRAALIASIPGDETSVAEAVRLHPDRFVGFFMFNPAAPGADEKLERVFTELRLRCVCLFPAMHRYRLDDPAVAAVFESAARHRAAVFVHCGVLSVGVRGKAGAAIAFRSAAWRSTRVVVGRGVLSVCSGHHSALRRRTLPGGADGRGPVRFDPLRLVQLERVDEVYPGLTLDAVFRQTLAVVGPRRLLFGTDSSFFPRGWQQPVLDAQLAAMKTARVSKTDRELILAGNFNRLFTTQD